MKPGWTEVALGEICEFRYGKALKAEERSGTGWPVYGSNGPVGFHHVALTDGPTVIIGRKGSYGEVHYSDEPVWPIDTTYFIDSTASNCDLQWLAYRLIGLQLTELNRAAAIPGLNREDAYRKRLLLPPLVEQRRIAGILNKADNLRKMRADTMIRLDCLVSASFRSTFGEVGNPQYPTLPLAEVLARPLQAGAYFPKTAYTSSDGQGVEMVHMSDAFYGRVTRGGLRRVVCSDHDRAKYTLNPGDLLIARRSLNYSGAARPCFVPTDPTDLLFESSLLRAMPDSERLTTDFLYWYLNDEQVRRTYVRKIVTGATIWGVNQANLSQMPILVPPIGLQKQFGRLTSAVDALRLRCDAHIDQLDGLFASLHHRSFTGDL